jgi:CRP/FNR family transcriptional regulator
MTISTTSPEQEPTMRHTASTNSDTPPAFAPAAGCARASLADLAPAFGLDAVEPDFAEITFPVRRLKAGDALVRAGDRFDAIYVIRSGFLKTVRTDAAGNEMVLALPMGGDAVGLDAIDPGHHDADVIALDATLVAAVPFAQLAQLGRTYPSLERALFRAFSRQLGRHNSMIWLLGRRDAESRLAAFLLDLSERFGRLGYSRTTFELRMTRQEIGSYLGIKLETVSRSLSALAAAGIIGVNRRTITLRDVPALRRIVEPRDAATPAAPPPARVRTPESRKGKRNRYFALGGAALAAA